MFVKSNSMKERIDRELVRRGIAKTKSLADRYIKDGKISVNGVVVTNSTYKVSIDEEIVLNKENLFVSRAGEKLSFALSHFGIDVRGKIALDVGSSTGGFTDCLLKNGIKKVYSVDVGTDQLDLGLRDDDRVVVMEKTDIRVLKKLPEEIDTAVVDVSFISLSLIIPHLVSLIVKNGEIVLLIKPQFEMPDSSFLKNGIVEKEEYRQNAVNKIKEICENNNLNVIGIIKSPIIGGSGNIEFLLYANLI